MLAAHLTQAIVLFGVANQSPCYISLRTAWISVLLCLASSQSLCLAFSMPDSLQGSPYCEGLGEERGGGENLMKMLLLCPPSAGGSCSVLEPLLGSAGTCFGRKQDMTANLNLEVFLFVLPGWY